ncbi:helix-turn-helix domain-containing protein [Pediococcus pentosaceus]|uniref:helix-turn-helix domain-containing protein n=1 Tax=Pediococcus pentosaceus TaxID=1255 RepID=UPI0039823B31
MADAKEFGLAIKHIRERKGYSVRQVAANGEMSPSYLSRVENGFRPIPQSKTLFKIAQGLHVDPKEIFSLTGRELENYTSNSDMNLNIGDRISSLRRNNHETLHQVSEATHIPENIIDMLETGLREPSATESVSLANHWHVSVDYLLTGKTSDFTPEQYDAMREEVVAEDTKPYRLAAHTSSKDLSSRDVNADLLREVLDSYLQTDEGKEIVENLLKGKEFDPKNF